MDSETDTLIRPLFDEEDYTFPPTPSELQLQLEIQRKLVPPHQPRGGDNKNDMTLISPSDYHYFPDLSNHRGSAPLLHVFSICINTPTDMQKPRKIYGNITIIEEQGGLQFELFDRSRDDPEIIYNTGASLSFSGSTGVPMLRGATLSVHLKDCDQDESEYFVEHKITLDALADVGKQEEYSYDKIHTVVITGNGGGSITVYYTTVLYGIDAIIEVKFFDNETCLDSCIPADDDHLVLRAYSSKYKAERHLSTVIFNEPLDLFVDDGPVYLIEKQVIVVPVYSSLIIDVYMAYHGFEKYYGCVEVSAYTGPFKFQAVTTPWGRLEVRVDWGGSFAESFVGRSLRGSLTPGVNDTDLYSCRMEIFSIRVCGIDRDVLDVYGTVIMCDRQDRYYIFKRDEKNPESLLPGRDTVP